MVVFNLGFETRAALSVVSPSTITQKSALEQRPASSPSRKFFLSPASRALINEAPAYRGANLAPAMGAADRVVFSSDEIKDWREFAANRPGHYRTVWSRMQDVNWDYYPSWDGNVRILDMAASDLKSGSHPGD